VRSGLSGLTLRGRAFVAAGVTALVCAIALGQTTLVRVGVLVLVLPLAAAYFVGRRRHDLSATRVLHPRLVAAGQTTRVDLEVSNAGGTASGALLVEDQVPYALGARPRFVLQGLGREWRRTVHYQVRSDVRGQYTVGPLTVRNGDPFGLLEVRRVVPGAATLTVTPRTVALPRTPLTGGWSGSGEHRPQSFASGSAEDVSVREYRRGDELRRVHWRSSARRGELMVRREEQPWEARATVLLDNRTLTHRGQGLGSSFEVAVSVAASVAVHLDAHGFTVRFATADGWATEAGESAAEVLERLAVIRTEPISTIDTHWHTETSGGGLMVAVLGRVDDGDVGTLRRLRHHADTALAMVLDVEQWLGLPADPGRNVAAPASTAGWRTVAIGPRDRVDAAWSSLARSATRTAAANVAAARASGEGLGS
jgi:uncharacterized protein (DUF58 family)